MRTQAIVSWVIGAVLLFGMGAAAEAREDTVVCWGQYETLQDCLVGTGNPADCLHTCHLHGYDKHFACPGGGFNRGFACQQLCGKPEGQGCEVRGLHPGVDGNACGYSWVNVSCF
jgi:hypothetical protein